MEEFWLDFGRQAMPMLQAIALAYGVSLASWLIFWIIRTGIDRKGDVGVGAFTALVAADLLICREGVASACLNLGWLFDSPPDGFYRTLSFLLMIFTILLSIPALILQRDGRAALAGGQTGRWAVLSLRGAVLSSAIASLHLVWIMRLPT